MQFYIKELSERTVALMIGTGQVLAYFPSVLEAVTAIKEWYQFNGMAPQDEIMLGGAGEMIMISGIGIRRLLFLLTVASFVSLGVARRNDRTRIGDQTIDQSLQGG